MKLMIALIVILFNIPSNAQGLNGEIGLNANYGQYSKGIVALEEFSYTIVRQSIANSFFTSSVLVKIDTLQNVIWSNTIAPPFAETIDVHEIIASESGAIYLLGFGVPTCDVMGNCFWFIQKYDPNGVAAWTKLVSSIGCFDVTMSGLSLNASNEVLVNYYDMNESKIYTINAGGLISDSLTINRSNLKGINESTNYDKIAFKQDSIFGFNQTGTVSNSLGFTTLIKNINVLNDTLFVLTNDSIFTFDSNFQEISSTTLAGNSNYSNLKISSNTIEFLSHAPNNQTVISLNHQLSLTNTIVITVTIGSSVPKDFSDSHFSASINFSLTEYTTIRHLDYSLTTSQNEIVNTTDIGVIGVQPTQIIIQEYSWVEDVYHYTIYADVMIKNFGNYTLNDCRINHHIGQGIACGQSYYTEHFSNLNLAPNDSIWLSLGLIHVGENYFLGDTISKEICVYTSHPNYKTDLNVSNDEFCELIILGYTDLTEIPFDEMMIYPNPTNKYVNIQLNNAENTKFTLYNMQGVKIKTGDFNSDPIDVSTLSNGIYLVHLLSKDGSINYKNYFVKE